MIGIAINYLLKSSTALTALVGSKIFPFYVDEITSFPSVMYQVVSRIPTYVKDETIEETSTVEIYSFSFTYLESLTVSNIVRSVLEFSHGSVQGIPIKQIRIEKIEENFDFDSNVFYSKITFTIKTN